MGALPLALEPLLVLVPLQVRVLLQELVRQAQGQRGPLVLGLEQQALGLEQLEPVQEQQVLPLPVLPLPLPLRCLAHSKPIKASAKAERVRLLLAGRWLGPVVHILLERLDMVVV